MKGRNSVESLMKRSNISSRSSDVVQDRKEFLHGFVDREIFKEAVASWFEDITQRDGCSAFSAPFELKDLQKFDYALEGVSFLQLIRMPNTIYASTSSGVESTSYLALEDFLHECMAALWSSFWGSSDDGVVVSPFFVSSIHGTNYRFYQAEKAISKGILSGLCGSGVMLKNPRHPQPKWDDIVELALMRPGVGSLVSFEDDSTAHFGAISEALFFALRVLVARSVSKSDISMNSNSVFMILVDSQNGCVVKVEGDISKLEFHPNSVYRSAATWYKNYSQVSISSVYRIWNTLGNSDWRDIGALHVLYAMFHSLVQYAGMPKHSIKDLAAEHDSRLCARRYERLGDEQGVKENHLLVSRHRNVQSEIIHVQEEYYPTTGPEKMVNLEVGNVVLVKCSNFQQGYQIDEILDDGEATFYIASLVEDPGSKFFLYTGSLISQQESAFEGMISWYQVQRQTKVLNIMRQRNLSSKHLPKLVASGHVVHPGQCRKSSTSQSSYECDYSLCGAPVLVTTPVGRTVADMVRAGQFDSDEAIRCCHDCLSALSCSAGAGIRHGNIGPENVVYVISNTRQPYYVLTGWGRSLLEENDRPAMNLHFSSTSALQERSLCSASDAESLVYLLYFATGGDSPVLDSIERALRWREASWTRRVIQQKLGDISAVLKAFADYVDSLCGTPYPVDYDVWIRRLRRHIQGEESGKQVIACE